MTNRRVISSSIFEDEWYGPLSFFEQQLWIGLFAKCADDQGRLQDNSIVIRAQLFPYKEISTDEIQNALTKFADDGKIIRYERNGKRLIQLMRWWENQQPQWAAPSKWPSPEGWRDRVRTRINNQYVCENWASSPDKAPEQAPEPVGNASATSVSARHIPVPTPVPTPVPDPVPGSSSPRARASDSPDSQTPPPTADESALVAYSRANAGAIGPLEGDTLGALVSEAEAHRLKLPRGVKGWDVTGEQWVIAAIREADASKTSGRINTKFVQTILDRWEHDGFKSPRRSLSCATAPSPPPDKPDMIQPGESLTEFAERRRRMAAERMAACANTA